jgi:DNA-binding NtrC family response regulator
LFWKWNYNAIRRYKGDMRAVMKELGLPRRTLNKKWESSGFRVG